MDTAFRALVAIVLCSLAGATGLSAQTLDVEVDPLPWVLDGFSVAVGISTDHLRYEVEAFRTDVPESFHGNDGFGQRVLGGSLKASYYFGGTDGGPFAGVDLDVARAATSLHRTDAETTDPQVAAGVTAGYRIGLTEDLYVKPWVGLTWDFGASDVVLDGRRFEEDPLRPFPALSLGWRF